jgi:membrane protease YdiL (CAAX protease family)
MTASAEPGVARPSFGKRVSAVWLAIALAPMLASEIVRLGQSDPFAWIAWDYAGRILALALLAALPAARAVAFKPEKMRIAACEVALWIASLVAFDHLVDHALNRYVSDLIPGRLGGYPSGRGWLFALDLSVGLALVAYSEEVIFRRCLRKVLADRVGDNAKMVIGAALMFAGFHWWSGAGNIAAALSFGVVAMLAYRRIGALSPVVLAHYLCDVLNFADGLSA